MNPGRDDCTGSDLVPGSMIGFRTWRLRLWETSDPHKWMASVTDNGLYPLIQDVPWSREMVAECRAWNTGCSCIYCEMFRTLHQKVEHAQGAPLLSCECGLYAWHTCGKKMWEYRGEVAGVVEATGRVIVGEYGMRAEKMKVLGLCPVMDNAHSADTVPMGVEPLSEQQAYARGEEIAKELGVTWFPSIGAMRLEYPDQDVSSLLS